MFYTRQILLFTLAFLVFSSCKKGGNITHQIVYTTDKNAFRMLGGTDTTHEGFGAYITSITPSAFKAKMNIMAYQDFWNSEHMISYIDGHDNDPRFEIALYADFTGNAEVKPTPILYSTDMWDGVFKQKQVTLNYFIFVPYYINVDFYLPPAYTGKQLNQFTTTYDSIQKRMFCKTTEFALIKDLYAQNAKVPGGFAFGNTDSTFIFNKEGFSLEDGPDKPFGGPNYTQPIIRSNHYTPTTITMPDGGETIEMISTLSYNTEGIIQVYAGKDNVAYTQDDVFVYAPRYWERLKVKLETR